jgi:hypothetical protein
LDKRFSFFHATNILIQLLQNYLPNNGSRNQILYFRTNGMEWSDEHAGIKSRGFSFNYILLTEDGQFVFLSRNTEDFDIIKYFIVTPKAELTKDTSVMYGSYKIDNNVISCSYQILEIDYSGQFTFLSPAIILDKNLREYMMYPAKID